MATSDTRRFEDDRAPLRVLREAGTLEWFAVAGIWLLLNTAAIPDNLAARPDVASWKIVAIVLWTSCLWIAFTPPLFWLFDSLPITKDRALANVILRVVGMAVGAGLLAGAVIVSIRLLAGPLALTPGSFRSPNLPWSTAYADAAGSVGVTMLAHAWLRRLLERRRSDQRTASLEHALLESKLHALSLEFQPHFLFNTLNGIAELSREAPEKAEAMLIRLSTLLRKSLESPGEHGISLGEEIERLDLYRQIQAMRLGERVSFSTSIDPLALSAKVPAMLLQPLVENAISHGVGPRPGPGHIEVTVMRVRKRVLIRVADDGMGLTPGHSEGVGLTNSRARLAHMFAGRATLTVRPRPAGGTAVEIEIPFEARRDGAPHDPTDQVLDASPNR